MIDIENKVIDTIQNAYADAEMTVDVLGEYVLQPESFPCVMVRMISNSTYTRSMDNRPNAHHVNVSYQLDFFSNKEAESKQEVKDLALIADKAMEEMNFVLDSYNIITNEDRTISRATSRYSAIVEEGITKDGDTTHHIYRR